MPSDDPAVVGRPDPTPTQPTDPSQPSDVDRTMPNMRDRRDVDQHTTRPRHPPADHLPAMRHDDLDDTYSVEWECLHCPARGHAPTFPDHPHHTIRLTVRPPL